MIIGITGSVGKTTTKELLFSLLTEPSLTAQIGKVWKTPDNMNDNVGVPLSVLGSAYFPTISLRGIRFFLTLPFHALALCTYKQYPNILVLEYGAGKAGDISFNASRAVPHIAVITAVGPAHLVAFGDVSEVAVAKGGLVESVPSDGLVILGSDNPHLDEIRARTAAQVVVVEGRCEDLAPAIVRIIAQRLSVKTDCVESVIQDFSGVRGRFRLEDLGDVILVDDAFNANPLSMRCGLERLARLGTDQRRRRVAILGWMGELGAESEDYHRRVAPLAAGSADLVVGVGDLAQQYQPDLWFPTSAACAAEISDFVSAGDVVLVKGSHSVGLVVVNDAIRRWADGMR